MRRRLLLACLVGILALAALGVAMGAGRLSMPGSGPSGPSSAAVASPSGLPSPEPVPGSAPPQPTPAATPEPSPTPRPATNPRVRRQLQDALDEYRTEASIPGLSASIVFPDGSTWTGVSGDAIVESRTPVEPETAFAAASISKMFTAALVLDLSAEGRFALPDRVGSYLPDIRLVGSVTIRQLLDHTSGLHDYFLNPRIDAALPSDRGRAWTTAETLRFVGKPYFPPGTGWHYSNTNYLLLGMLAERVTGRPLAEELRERYFEPLGLTTAFIQVDEKPRGPIAHGYRFAGPGLDRPPIDLAEGSGVVPFRSVVTASGGAGSVAASSLDIARWAHALYNDRATQPGTAALMLAGVEHVAPYGPRVPYGLGVQVIQIDARYESWGHSGRFLGARSAVRYIPDADVAIAVMTNQSRTDTGPLVARVLRIILPPPRPCGPCPLPL
jgi:D-alanyl-D-alanine carboxypeptidase